MTGIQRRRGWEIPEREATPEEVFLNRRRFLRSAGLAGLGLAAGCGSDRIITPVEPEPEGETALPTVQAPPDQEPAAPEGGNPLYPAELNPEFGTLDRPLTEEEVAGRYNNFYEFTQSKQVHLFVDHFETRPWTVEVSGLVEKPATFDIDDLVRRMPLEERLYRFRCVEAWSMAVPWTGFPVRALIDLARPLSAAKFVSFTSFFDTENARGQWNTPELPWPYVEGLSMPEALNELTMMVTGIYGHELPVQHGAPIRLIVPWKYGMKSIKSVVRIEFVAEQPANFWNIVNPREYDFWLNVNPDVPHPRWSQAQERMIGIWEWRPTLLYNGYEEYVAGLYA